MKLNFDDIKNTLKYETYLNLINILINKEFQNKEINEMLEAANRKYN